MREAHKSEAYPTQRAVAECSMCCGARVFPMLDPWKAKADDHPGQEFLVRKYLTLDVPCPECRKDEFWAYLERREADEGYPLGAPAETIVMRTMPAGLSVIMQVSVPPRLFGVIGR